MHVRQSKRKKQMRVFIADDSSIVVERMVDLLKEVPGVEFVGQAGNVQDSINGIHRLRPDAVILDLQMPGGTGIDVLRTVRREHPGIYVVVCTNYPPRQYREECFNNGADHFLDK